MKTMKVLFAAVLFGSSAVASADNDSNKETMYRVTIVNITSGISFTPFLAATHKMEYDLFSLGEASSPELARIAESGDVSALNQILMATDRVYATTTTEGLLMPGKSVTLDIKTPRRNSLHSQLSIAAMLLPTNDAFVALNSVRLPKHGTVTYFAKAYDAGSEHNDELCANIPGPTCGGQGLSASEGGEGFVYPSPGIHGEGDLSVAKYNWDGAVAKVTVMRMY